jgi:hypothetical protein
MKENYISTDGMSESRTVPAKHHDTRVVRDSFGVVCVPEQWAGVAVSGSTADSFGRSQCDLWQGH